MTARIAIIGSALSGNKGASAMLEAAVEGLSARLPGARFSLFSMYPEEDLRLNEYKNLAIIPASPFQLGVIINLLALLHFLFPPLKKLLGRNSTAIRALSQADVLLDQGGITFSDGREKFLLYNVASVLPAMLLGVPVVKCAQAIGPFENPINRLVAKVFLPKMELIVTRGAITHELASGLELQNTLAGADMAFTLAHPTPEDAPAELKDDGHKAGTVGVSPSVVMEKKIAKSGGDYAVEIARFIEYLAQQGFDVVLLPHSVRTGTEKTHNNDLPLCRTIFSSLSQQAREQTRFLETELPARSLRAEIAKCDVFVTSRFHAMVSGLATATPTLVIGWSHKYEEVLAMFGAESWTMSSADFSQERLREKFEALWAERRATATSLSNALPDVRAKAEQQLDRIAELCR